MHEKRFRHGDAIFDTGQPSDVVYLLRSCTVRRKDEDAEDAPVDMTFGLRALLRHDGILTGGSRRISAGAVADVALFAMAGPGNPQAHGVRRQLIARAAQDDI